MKFSSIILSLILIVLSCLPCADGLNNNGSKQHIDVAEKHSGHEQENHTDLCSPFCICNCCGVQVLSFAPSLAIHFEEESSELIVKPDTIYHTHFASMFSGSIWQPPQIA